MKKRIIIGITIMFVLLLGTYVTLVVTKVFPNPFLDTSDLVCKKITPEVDYESNKIITISFDKWAIVNGLSQKEEISFKNVSEAQVFYKEMKESIGYDYEKYLNIIDNKVIINKDDYELQKDDLVSREQSKKIYDKGGYKCE